MSLAFLLLGGLVATGAIHYLKKKESSPVVASSTPASPKKPLPDLVTQSFLAQPPSAPGIVTPERAAVHGDLMRRCNDPKKLKQAATLFGHEGLPLHASALLKKAATVHEMMHGAKEIVERSRAGDQHAMAIAKGIGDQARAGNERARLSWILIQQYTEQNPAQTAEQALAGKPA